MIYWFASDYSETMLEKYALHLRLEGGILHCASLWDSDLQDLRYLYRFGEYVTENELRMARYVNSLPEEKIALMADTYTGGLPHRL